MERKIRRTITDATKVKVVIQALREAEPLSSIASKYEIHVNQIRTWKRQFLENAEKSFSGDKSNKKEIERLNMEKEALQRCLGEKAMEVDYLKKNLKKLNLL